MTIDNKITAYFCLSHVINQLTSEERENESLWNFSEILKPVQFNTAFYLRTK